MISMIPGHLHVREAALAGAAFDAMSLEAVALGWECENGLGVETGKTTSGNLSSQPGFLRVGVGFGAPGSGATLNGVGGFETLNASEKCPVGECRKSGILSCEIHDEEILNLEGVVEREWLPDMDLNHDKQIQSLLCYRYTIGQCGEQLKPKNQTP